MRTTTTSRACDHRPFDVGDLSVVACATCQTLMFGDTRGPVPGHTGLGRLFGDFDLVGSLPALCAPADTVLLYRPPRPRDRRALEALPQGGWLAATDGVWVSSDGDHLLIAHDSPWVTRRLLDGA